MTSHEGSVGTPTQLDVDPEGLTIVESSRTCLRLEIDFPTVEGAEGFLARIAGFVNLSGIDGPSIAKRIQAGWVVKDTSGAKIIEPIKHVGPRQ
ncbi:MAG: hypothetical protein AAB532_02670 [Patescibacteria group bacterium]